MAPGGDHELVGVGPYLPQLGVLAGVDRAVAVAAHEQDRAGEVGQGGHVDVDPHALAVTSAHVFPGVLPERGVDLGQVPRPDGVLLGEDVRIEVRAPVVQPLVLANADPDEGQGGEQLRVAGGQSKAGVPTHRERRDGDGRSQRVEVTPDGLHEQFAAVVLVVAEGCAPVAGQVGQVQAVALGQALDELGPVVGARADPSVEQHEILTVFGT